MWLCVTVVYRCGGEVYCGCVLYLSIVVVEGFSVAVLQLSIVVVERFIVAMCHSCLSLWWRGLASLCVTVVYRCGGEV